MSTSMRYSALIMVGYKHENASFVGTFVSIKLAWGPITQLNTRNLYHNFNNAVSLNLWLAISDGVLIEIFLWKDLPRLSFDSNISPSPMGLSIKFATDANNFGWGGHTLSEVTFIAHEYFSAWESIQSCTYRKLLGGTRCLQCLVEHAKANLLYFN